MFQKCQVNMVIYSKLQEYFQQRRFGRLSPSNWLLSILKYQNNKQQRRDVAEANRPPH